MWAWPGSRDPRKYFWALNANSSKMAKDTNFKFDGSVPRVRNVTPDKSFRNVGVASVT